MSKSPMSSFSKVSTADIKDELRNATSISDVLNKFDGYMQTRNLAEYLNILVAKHNIIIADVVRDSGIDKGYVYHIFNGKRKNPSRDKMIAIAFGMHLNEEETQRMLKLAGHRELYAMVPRDAAILFAIQHGMSIEGTDEALFKKGLPTILSE